MKVYSISKWAFYGISILILVLPVSKHWRLLADGKKASGAVIAYSRVFIEKINGDLTIEYASEIQFQAEGMSYKARGPLNYEYDPGRTVNVMYDPEDPSTNCVLTFSGLYLNNYLVLPIILLVLWAAFYLSFNKFLLVFCTIIIGSFCSIFAGASAAVTEISPSMGETEINELLNSANPGDTLLFLPGTYKGPFVLTGVHGDINLPVVITGASLQKEGAAKQMEGAAVIDGQTDPGIFLQHHAFLLQDCSWISIENFTIRNCWTDLILAMDVSYLSVRHCNMTGGKRALFATGRGSHHFLVEHCNWEQDERVWTHDGDYSWDEIHHGVHKHFNGSLFQGSEISGVFVLRDNMIKNTFNAFRLSQMNDGATDLLACTNGEIYRNTIINTSDNVLEPELHTLNLHFYHNRMINGHAFVSITEVTGGEIYIYGNTAVSRPESDDGWTIFKISSRTKELTMPLYIFNNSWHVDFDMIGSPRNVWRNNHLRHFNNACFSAQSDSFGIYNIGRDNHFDYDCSNVPFPRLLIGNGFENNGLVGDPLFLDPMGNDFRLKENSPCIDRGIYDSALIMGYKGEAPDIGAYDHGELIQGPPFRYMQPGPKVPFEEMPRITRYQTDGELIKVWFSVPLAEGSVKSTEFKITTSGKIHDLKVTGLSEDGYCLTLAAEQRLAAGDVELLFSRWPEGQNGMPVTSWASPVHVKLL